MCDKNKILYRTQYNVPYILKIGNDLPFHLVLKFSFPSLLLGASWKSERERDRKETTRANACVLTLHGNKKKEFNKKKVLKFKSISIRFLEKSPHIKPLSGIGGRGEKRKEEKDLCQVEWARNRS